MSNYRTGWGIPVPYVAKVPFKVVPNQQFAWVQLPNGDTTQYLEQTVRAKSATKS